MANQIDLNLIGLRKSIKSFEKKSETQIISTKMFKFNQTTYLKIINHTEQNIVDSEVWNYDSFDFMKNPNINIGGLMIPAGHFIRKPVYINSVAKNCTLSMSITFSDGTYDAFRFHQRDALYDEHSFVVIAADHIIKYGKTSHSTYLIRVYNTQEQINMALVEKKNQEGHAELKLKHYKLALKKFNEANDMATFFDVAKPLNSKQRSECLTFIGMKIFDEGLTLEEQGIIPAADVNNKYKKTEENLKNARNIYNSEACKRYLKLVQVKMAGNKFFNNGVNLERDAFVLWQDATRTNKYKLAHDKYKEALFNYEQARKNFEEGAKIEKKLNECVKICNETKTVIQNLINTLDKLILSITMTNLNVDDQKQVKKEKSG